MVAMWEWAGQRPQVFGGGTASASLSSTAKPKAKRPTSLTHHTPEKGVLPLFKHRKPSLRPLCLFLLPRRLILQILAELATSFHSVFSSNITLYSILIDKLIQRKGTLAPLHQHHSP